MMYCKACGEENEHTAIYCKHDGIALKRGSALFQKGQVYKFCQACGGNVTSSQSYCMDCGSYLLQYERKENGINMSTFNLYLWLGVLILLLLFLWSGYQIAQQGENVVQHVLIFSLCYGVFMAMLSVVTKFSFETIESGVGTTSNVVFSIGLGPISMFIRATILAGVVAYGGTWIAKMRERQNK